MNIPQAPNPFSQAVTLTTKTIDGRSRQFRDTIIAVVIVVAAAIGTALIIRSVRPLSGILLLPIIVNAFILFDSRIIESWRADVLDSWVKGEIDLEVYVQTLSAMKALPRTTIDGMLQFLPLQSQNIVKNDVGLRSAIAQTLSAINRRHVIRSSALFCGSVAIIVPIVLAILTWSFLPLIGIDIIVIVFVAWFFMEKNIWRALQESFFHSFPQGTLESEKAEKAISALAWDSISEKRKNSVLLFLRHAL